MEPRSPGKGESVTMQSNGVGTVLPLGLLTASGE